MSWRCSCSSSSSSNDSTPLYTHYRVNSQFSSGVTFSLNPPITLRLTGWMSRWSRTPSWCVATALGAKWQVNQASIFTSGARGGGLVSLSTTAPKKISHEVWFWAIWPLTPRSCHSDALPLRQPIPPPRPRAAPRTWLAPGLACQAKAWLTPRPIFCKHLEISPPPAGEDQWLVWKRPLLLARAQVCWRSLWCGPTCQRE